MTSALSVSATNAAVRRILIIKPSSLGDVLHTFPAVARLKSIYPNALFDWLIHPGCAAILDYSPVPIQRRILFKRKELGSWRIGVELPRLIRELHRGQYDLIVDFQGLLRSAAIGFCALGSRMAGFAHPKEPMAACFYGKQAFPVEMATHAVKRNWDLAGYTAGLPPSAVEVPRLPLIAAHREKAFELLRGQGWQSDKPLIALAPGARWESKCFPPEFFARVANALKKSDPAVQVALLGAAAEIPAAELIAAKTTSINLVGQTSLGELMEILRISDTLVCNDSGPMHLMAALGRRAAAFFGPTLADLTGPFGKEHLIFRRDDLKCLGCLKRQCPQGIVAACHELDAEAVGQMIMRKQ